MENENINHLTFGELLKAYRKRKRLTQRDLAAKLGTHYNTIYRWEQGDFLPETKGIIVEVAKQLSLNDRETHRLLEASLTALSPYWCVPYQRNPFFTGREDFLRHLHYFLGNSDTMASPKSYALHGLGGIGKTQTAIEYAYCHAWEYSAILWIDAKTDESCLSSLVAIAACLQLTEAQECDQQKIIGGVARWLSNHRDWLLILDNVEEVNMIKRLLPGVRQGALLFTTRRQTLGMLAQNVEVGPMTQEEGAQFLLRRTLRLKSYPPREQPSLDEYRAARTLTDMMDGLPLALDQAGAYIEETRCSLSGFLHLFQANPLQILQEYRAHSDYPFSVAKMLTLTFEELQRTNQDAAHLLIMCCFLGFDEISEELITEALLPSVPLTSFQIHAIFKDLQASALIRHNEQDRTISIYNLVQTVLKELAPETFPRNQVKYMFQLMKHISLQ